jgi:S1-C subfamily serine protease
MTLRLPCRFMLVAAVLLIVGTGWAADESKQHFNSGEKLLAAGKPFEAYYEFLAASHLKPSNRKYASKLLEAGKAASIRADTVAQESLQTDIKQAQVWFAQALSYDPSNSSAAQHMAELDRSISVARDTARNTISMVRRGDTAHSEGVLSNLTRFRPVIPEIDLAEDELRADRTLERAQSEWTQRDRINALRDVEQAEHMASADNTYVRDAARKLRTDVADFIVREIPSQPTSLMETVHALQLADTALSVDNANPAAIKLKMDEATNLRKLIFERLQDSFSATPANSARIALEILRRYEKWINSDDRFASEGEKLTKAAYPALQVRLVVSDFDNCEGAPSKDQVIAAVRQALGRVARLSESNADATIRLKKITCSGSDVPTDNVQQVNSTYVAGHTQLANPAYVQLEDQLLSAQADLNRAEYDYSVNQNFATGFAVGMARGRVNRLRNALAATPPYTDQEIVQQYQYQKFDAYRAYQIQAVITSDYDNGKAILGEQTVTAVKEDRKTGIAGVLAQDKSGVKNSQPVLTSMSECARVTWEDFTAKTASAVRDMVAKVLAKRAMTTSQDAADRVASIMYLSELAPGTSYESMANSMERYISAAVSSNQRDWPTISTPVLPVPEETVVAETREEDSSARVESALNAVLSIETDTGREGSGFFVAPSCLVVTNEHVISGAEIIIARTSNKKLLSAQLVSKDTERDLALLRTNAQGCSGLSFENNAKVGQEVFAIGSPLGLANTITRGIISAFRTTSSGVNYVQIDAALNPGNSGGPLITKAGSVVGVNTWQFKGAQGLNFAVSASEIKVAFRSFLR